jgi:hypothetical protein
MGKIFIDFKSFENRLSPVWVDLKFCQGWTEPYMGRNSIDLKSIFNRLKIGKARIGEFVN